jgi:hypothetical protein
MSTAVGSHSCYRPGETLACFRSLNSLRVFLQQNDGPSHPFDYSEAIHLSNDTTMKEILGDPSAYPCSYEALSLRAVNGPLKIHAKPVY